MASLIEELAEYCADCESIAAEVNTALIREAIEEIKRLRLIVQTMAEHTRKAIRLADTLHDAAPHCRTCGAIRRGACAASPRPCEFAKLVLPP